MLFFLMILILVPSVFCIDTHSDSKEGISNQQTQSNPSATTLNSGYARDGSHFQTLKNHRLSRFTPQILPNSYAVHSESHELSMVDNAGPEYAIKLHDKAKPHNHIQRTLQDNSLYSEPTQYSTENVKSTYPGENLDENNSHASQHRHHHQNPTFGSDFVSLYEEFMQNHATANQRFVPRWSPSALPLSDMNLIPHLVSESNNAGYFVYQKPSLQGSIWKSFQVYPKISTVIILKNDFDGLKFERKLTDFIHSIATQIEESVQDFQMPRLLPQLHGSLSTDFEFGLTSDELLRHRQIKAFQPYAFNPNTLSSENRIKAYRLFMSVSLHSDLANISQDILKSFNTWDQNQLGPQISFRLASLIYIQRYTTDFWDSLDSPKMRQKVEEFVEYNPASYTKPKTLNRKIMSGRYIHAVLVAIEIPSLYILDAISRVDMKLHQLASIRYQMQVQALQLNNLVRMSSNRFITKNHESKTHSSTSQSTYSHNSSWNSNKKDESNVNVQLENSASQDAPQTTSRKPFTYHQIFNSSAPNLSSSSTTSMTLYEKALLLLNIAPKIISKSKAHFFENALTQIKIEIENNLRQAQPLPLISEESRKELLPSLHRSLRACLSSEELIHYLDIHSAKVNRLQILNDLKIPNAIEMISRLVPGDDFVKFASKVLKFEHANQSIIFEFAGKYMAHISNILLCERYFWRDVAMYRLIELDRFQKAAFNFETVDVELEAGRKLLTVFKNVKDGEVSRKNIHLLKWKLNSLQIQMDDQL